MTRRTVLVTGAGGFVGRALSPVLNEAGWEVRSAGRRDVGDIGPDTDWSPYLAGAEAVIHLAARVHVMRDTAADPASEFDRTNHLATAALARQTKQAGIRRFVFLSSVKVHGDQASAALTGADIPVPVDPYGHSKLAAERALAGYRDALDVVILRPPLVYGPGVKGNFLSLLTAVDKGLPLPLAAIRNKRSLIYVANLADAILWALDAAPGTYLPRDREDISTPDLIRRTAEALGRPVRLFPVPVSVLRMAAALCGKRAAIDRLTGSLTVDGDLPGWRAPRSLEEGLSATAESFRSR